MNIYISKEYLVKVKRITLNQLSSVETVIDTAGKHIDTG